MKSVRASARGETNRRGLGNRLRVSHSTTIRAGRSQRLQMIARSPSRSPDCTPSVSCGRSLTEAITAGASPGNNSPAPTACMTRRRPRLKSLMVFSLEKEKLKHDPMTLA
ncbi:hypothetical protein D3C84_969740 [compost metagenome]